MVHNDYYRVLELNNNASADDIKKAYRRLAMQYHPDRNQGKEEWANYKFKEINEAFSVLGDPDKKRQYDHFGSVGDMDNIFSSQATQTTFEDLVDDFGVAGLGLDFLDDIFGDDFGRKGFIFRSFGRGFAKSTGARYRISGDIDFGDQFEKVPNPKMSSVNYEIVLSKEQASRGVEKELVRRGKQLKVRIPAGISIGSRIRLKDALKTTDGQPGDIIISIKVND